MPEYGVLTPRTIAKWIVMLLVVVGGVSVLVGFASAGWHDFDWTVASVFGTALGTTALAGFTGALAYTTSGDVRATWELAGLTQKDMERRERPVLVQQDAGFNGSPRDGYVKVVLYNAGLGSALRVTVNVDYQDAEHPVHATVVRPAIRPEGTDEFKIPVQFAEPYPPGGPRGDGFALSGTCWDTSLKNEYPIITSWE